jgi:lambda repressor-like predicted transcriptional regulator
VTAFPAAAARRALERRAVHDGVSVRELGETLSVSRSTLQRLYDRDWLRYDAADLIATVLGQHPSELWDDWFDPHDLPQAARTTHRDGPAAQDSRASATAAGCAGHPHHNPSFRRAS